MKVYNAFIFISIDVEGFFSEGGQTRPPRMLKFFSGGKVGGRGGK